MKVYDELLLKRIAAVGWQIHMVLPAAWQLPRLNDTSSSATSPQSQKLLHQLTKTTCNTGKKFQVQNLVLLRVWNFGVFSKCTNNFEIYRTGIMNPLHYKTLSWHILPMSIPVGTKCMFSINRKYFITFIGKLHMSVCNSHFTRVFFCLWENMTRWGCCGFFLPNTQNEQLKYPQLSYPENQEVLSMEK